ncbi:MAG: YbdD/YjiX family protein [Gemmatimonadaceae bacterium]
MSRLLGRLAYLAVLARRVAGAPDYDGYVAHVRSHHPGAEPLGRDEFYLARLEERYSKPGARCC